MKNVSEILNLIFQAGDGPVGGSQKVGAVSPNGTADPGAHPFEDLLNRMTNAQKNGQPGAPPPASSLKQGALDLVSTKNDGNQASDRGHASGDSLTLFSATDIQVTEKVGPASLKDTDLLKQSLLSLAVGLE